MQTRKRANVQTCKHADIQSYILVHTDTYLYTRTYKYAGVWSFLFKGYALGVRHKFPFLRTPPCAGNRAAPWSFSAGLGSEFRFFRQLQQASHKSKLPRMALRKHSPMCIQSCVRAQPTTHWYRYPLEHYPWNTLVRSPG